MREGGAIVRREFLKLFLPSIVLLAGLVALLHVVEWMKEQHILELTEGSHVDRSMNIIHDEHNGSLDVESAAGKGTKFIIKLPLMIESV